MNKGNIDSLSNAVIKCLRQDNSRLDSPRIGPTQTCNFFSNSEKHPEEDEEEEVEVTLAEDTGPRLASSKPVTVTNESQDRVSHHLKIFVQTKYQQRDL